MTSSSVRDTVYGLGNPPRTRQFILVTNDGISWSTVLAMLMTALHSHGCMAAGLEGPWYCTQSMEIRN
jgi:hypothetical protein